MFTCVQELAAAERGKRVAQNERDEANEELSTSNLSKNSLLDEKKRLEARVNALEDEMEEEASNSELAMEKARKLQAQVCVVLSLDRVFLIKNQEKRCLCRICLTVSFLN